MKNGKIIILFIFIIILCGGCYQRKDNIIEQSQNNQEQMEKQLFEQYQACLINPLIEDDETEDIIQYKNELTNYLMLKYKVSVQYEDINLHFNYSYNSSKVYYAASTIKVVPALYIYKEAQLGHIDLDSTIIYLSSDQRAYSAGMKNYKIGDKISLRDLVQYTLMYSDNTAYRMLVRYIGKQNIREYGLSLGANKTMSGVDDFGYITTGDSLIYMKAIDDFIKSDFLLGAEFKSFMINSDQNNLKYGTVDAATKYGEYSYYYHNIGIVYEENPYIIAILTTEHSGNFEDKIRDINMRASALHNMYYNNRKNRCKTLIYGE